MSVSDMPLNRNLADAIGEVAIHTIIESSLHRVATVPDDPGSGAIVIWSANAAEQIGHTLMSRFAINRLDEE